MSKSIKQAIKEIKALTGHARYIGEFYGTDDKSGIWFSGENTIRESIEGIEFDSPVYNSSGCYGLHDETLGLHPKIHAILESAGLFMEPYDAGTCLAYPKYT